MSNEKDTGVKSEEMCVISKDDFTQFIGFLVVQTNMLEDLHICLKNGDNDRGRRAMENLRPFVMSINNTFENVDRLVKKHKLKGFTILRPPEGSVKVEKDDTGFA